MPNAADIERSLCLPPGPGNPRNSEGDFVQLCDGRLLFVYSHFTERAHDDGAAFLAGRFSSDGGRTWTDEDLTIVPNPPGRNVMSVSLLRLDDGRIALFYLIKETTNDWRVLMRTSADEAATWSDPVLCSPLPGVYVMNNDRAVQLRGGRIVLPVAYRTPEEGRSEPEELIACILSDDAGATWRLSREGRRVPGVWTQEPGVIELMDGRVMMFCRTQVGSQYVTNSSDGGETWTELAPSNITSPLAPASVKRIPQTGDLLLVWNNVSEPWTGWDTLRRSPLNAAISRDEGKTWQNVKTIEDDPARWFCYAAIAFLDDRVLLAYAAGGGQGAQRMSTLRIARLPVEWLYAP